MKLSARKYRIGELLGEGAWGKVFRIETPEGPLAVKFLKNELGEKGRVFFQEEVRTLAQLRHPYLVKILDYFDRFPFPAPQIPSGPCFSMELVSGPSMEEVQEKSFSEILNYFIQSGQALHYLHFRNICHRDLKPSNLRLDERGRVKLLDFGLAGEIRKENFGQAHWGAFAFLPPEAYFGDWDEKSDLFGWAATFYYLLAGRPPFSSPLTPASLRSQAAPVWLHELRSEIPVFFSELLREMLSFSPSSRPNSVQAVLGYLETKNKQKEKSSRAEGMQWILPQVATVGRDEILQSFDEIFIAHPSLEKQMILLQGPMGVGRTHLLRELRWKAVLAGYAYFEVEPSRGEDWRRVLFRKLRMESLGDAPPQRKEILRDMDRLPKIDGVLAFSDLHLWPEAIQEEILILAKALLRKGKISCLVLEYDSDRAAGALSKNHSADGICDTRTFMVEDLDWEASCRLAGLARHGANLSSKAVTEAARLSGGRPAFLMEVIRAFAENSELKSSSFLDFARRRIEALPGTARSLLAILLVSRLPLGWEEFREFYPDAESELRAAFDLLVQLAILAPRQVDSRFWRLRYLALAKKFCEVLSPKEKREAHQKLSEFYQEKIRKNGAAKGQLGALLYHALKCEQKQLAVQYGIEALQAMEADGELQDLIELSEALLKIEEPTLDRRWLWILRASCFFRLGKWEEALAQYRSWRQAGRLEGDASVEPRFCFYQGMVLFSQGALETAEASLNQAIKLCGESGDKELLYYQVRAWNYLASIARARSQLAAAQQYAGRALRFSEGQALLAGEAEQILAEVATEMLDFAAAENHLRRMEKHYRKAGHSDSLLAIAESCRGRICLEKGELRQAERHWDRAARISSRQGELLDWARHLGNRSLALTRLGKIREAKELFENARGVLQYRGNEEDHLLLDLHHCRFLLGIGDQVGARESLAGLRDKIAIQKKLQWTESFHLLEAEEAMVGGQWARAEEVYRSCLIAPLGKARNSVALSAKAGFLMARIHRGVSWGQDEVWAELKAELNEAAGPRFQAWKSLLCFLELDPRAASPRVFESSLRVVERDESPEWRMDAYALLAKHFSNAGLARMSEALLQKYTNEFSVLLGQLPEEMKMDFQKSRDLAEIENLLEQSSRSKETGVSSQSFRTFCETNRAILEKGTLSAVLEKVLDAAIEMSGAERGFLILREDPGKDLDLKNFKVVAVRRMDKKTAEEAGLQFSWGVVREAWATRGPIWTDNAQHDKRFETMQSVVDFQLKSIVVLPLFLEEGPLGCLYMDQSRHLKALDSQNMEMLIALADQAALAIQKTRLVEALTRAMTELEQRVAEQFSQIETLSEELQQARHNLKFAYPEIVGQSPAMLLVFRTLDRVSPTRIPVWIWGESGTGKELVARSLHANSPWHEGPFISENCSAIPEALLESELFGHKKGAFTHAEKDRKGLFELASGGTLFLDEVADMSMAMQAKLLRVLQEGQVRPLGSGQTIPVKIRLVTASNRDLEEMVKKGEFREDLFYRINGLTLRLPPLRERKEDIPLLARHLLEKLAKENSLSPSKLSRDGMEYLLGRHWAGNIRELEGVLRTALLFASGETLTRKLFQENERLTRSHREEAPELRGAQASRGENPEREILVKLLIKHDLDKVKVAEEMGMSVKSIYNLLQRQGFPTKKSLLKQVLFGPKDVAGKQ